MIKGARRVKDLIRNKAKGVGKENYSGILSDIESNSVMAKRRNSYANSHEYSDSIEWESVLDALGELRDARWNSSSCSSRAITPLLPS